MPSPSRKTADLPLDEKLVAEARDLGIDLSGAAETGIAAAVKAEKERRWLTENAEAIKAYNDYIDENGPPLADFRPF